MPKVLQSCSTDDINWVHTPAETSFFPLAMNYGDDGFASAEESQVDITARFAGVYSYFSVHVALNSLTTASTVFRFRKNGANGNQSVTVPPGVTGIFSDITNTDSVVDGDKFNGEMVTDAGGAGSLTMGGINSIFRTNSGNVVLYGCANSNNITVAASTLYYLGLAGSIAANTVLQNGEVTMGGAGTFTKAQLYVVTNTRSTSTTFRLIINGVASNITITVPGGSTGLFEDTSNTDTIAADDKVCWGMQTGTGTGAIGLRRVNVYFEATSGKKFTTISHDLAGTAKTAGQSMHAPLGGCIPPSTTAEAESQVNAGYPFRATKLRIGVSANPLTGSSTCVLRKNGADTALTVTIPASTTGLFSDVANSVDFLADDEVNYRWTGGTSGTGATARYFQLDMEDLTPTGSSQVIFF